MPSNMIENLRLCSFVVLALMAVEGSPVGNCPSTDPLNYTIHLADSEICTIFYKCDHGSPVLFHCPSGLDFNPIKWVCDWPKDAGCAGDGSGSTNSPGNSPTPSTSAPGGSDPSTSSPETPCPAVGVCPVYDSSDDIVKHLPHATNCSLFCRCVHGVPRTESCPSGLWFNPRLEVCDWPQNSGCTANNGSSTDKPTQNPTDVTPTTVQTSPTSGPTTDTPICPAIGTCPVYDSSDDIVKHLPHATNCSLFCRCVHGVPRTESCPSGLWFNPRLEVCDWPQNSGCASNNGSSTQTPTNPTDVPSSPTSGPTSDTSAPTSPTAGPSTDAPICPAIGTCPVYDSSDDIVKHLPHATNCSLFCRCVHGVPRTESCPSGLWFNPRLEVCDWPQNSGCASNNGSSTQSPTNPTDVPSSPTPSPSTEPTSAPSTAAPLCPAIGSCPVYDSSDDVVKHLPHASNCSLYCRCDHGVPITMPCAPGTWFNPVLEVCDWPQNSGCISEGTSTSESSSTTVSSPSSSSTSNTPAGDCDAVGTCPVYDENSVVVHLPSQSDCTVYCRCDHGVPIKMPCPDGLYFNPTLQVCDWPDHAGCQAASK